MESIYLIKDLSRLSGLSVYTIKYYLKLGLIKEISRSQETNFRYFNDSTVEELKKIIALRREKVSLGKIKDMGKMGQSPSGTVPIFPHKDDL